MGRGRGQEQGKAETLSQLFCKASLGEPPASPSFLPQVKDPNPAPHVAGWTLPCSDEGQSSLPMEGGIIEEGSSAA